MLVILLVPLPVSLLCWALGLCGTEWSLVSAYGLFCYWVREMEKLPPKA